MATRKANNLPQQNPKIAALETGLQELRRAPLFQKAAKAEHVAELSLSIVRDHDARLAALETQNMSVAVDQLEARGALNASVARALRRRLDRG